MPLLRSTNGNEQRNLKLVKEDYLHVRKRGWFSTQEKVAVEGLWWRWQQPEENAGPIEIHKKEKAHPESRVGRSLAEPESLPSPQTQRRKAMNARG